MQVEYTYDGLASYTDTADMVILSVNPTPSEILLDVGSDTVVDAQAVPDPSDVGGVLEWYINWESDPKGDADLDPGYSGDHETTLVTAVSFGTGNLMVEYSLDGKVAYGTVPIMIGGVKIVTPTVIDLGVSDTTNIDCTAGPSGGTFSWSLVEGGSPTAGGTFAQSTDEDPTFTGTTAGTAMAKVQYTIDGKPPYFDSILCTVRKVEVTQSSSVIPIGEYATFVCDETPAYETSEGALTWSVIDGEGEILFTSNSDTTVYARAKSAGTTLVEVKYEGSGETQGYDTDQFECTVIKVEIDSAPAWISLGDSTPLHALPTPGTDITSGTLNWSLLDPDAGMADVTSGGMFDPNNSTSAETCTFTATGVGTGNHILQVDYTVNGVTTSDSKAVKILGDLSIIPGLGLFVNAETRSFQALNANGVAYDTTLVTWSILEDANGVCKNSELAIEGYYDTALFTAHETNVGTCIVKCELDANPDIFDTAEVTVLNMTMTGAYAYGSFHPAIVAYAGQVITGISTAEESSYLRTENYYLFPEDGLVDDQEHRQFGLLCLDFPDALSNEFVLRDEEGEYCYQIRPDMYEGKWWDDYRELLYWYWGDWTTAEGMYLDLVNFYDIPLEEANKGLWWETPYYFQAGIQSGIRVFNQEVTFNLEIKLEILALQATEWLVTHNPSLEAVCQASDGRYKQAELMGNNAIVMMSKPANFNNIVCKLVQEGLFGDTVLATLTTYTDDGQNVIFTFHTDKDGVNGADTDANGAIYVEGVMLPDGPTDWDTKYAVVVYVDGEECASRNITIGPLLNGLTFSPNVLQGVTFDPYSDVVDVQWDFLSDEDEEGYGLKINYELEDKVKNLNFDFKDVAQGGGDMGGTHRLTLDSAYLKKSTVLTPHREIKWEGFDASLDEEGHRIKEWPDEGEIENVPFAPAHVVGEGTYCLDIGLERDADIAQTQKIQVILDVEYGTE